MDIVSIVISVCTALISAGGAVIVCIVNNAYQAGTTRKLIEYRLQQLEAKVDQQNTLGERVFALEKELAIMKEKYEKD